MNLKVYNNCKVIQKGQNLLIYTSKKFFEIVNKNNITYTDEKGAEYIEEKRQNKLIRYYL